MFKSKFMPTVVLSAICIVVALILAAVNLVTAPAIAEALEKKTTDALLEVLPNGVSFEKIDTAGLPSEVTAAYKAESGGYVFQMTVTGYKSGLIIMCGLDENGKISGAKYLSSSETLGAENQLGDMYIGKDKSDYSSVDTISGATMTSNGYKNAVRAALEAYEILTGGKK